MYARTYTMGHITSPLLHFLNQGKPVTQGKASIYFTNSEFVDCIRNV